MHIRDQSTLYSVININVPPVRCWQVGIYSELKNEFSFIIDRSG